MNAKAKKLAGALAAKDARPVEVWLLRLVLAYFGVKIGIDATEAAK